MKALVRYIGMNVFRQNGKIVYTEKKYDIVLLDSPESFSMNIQSYSDPQKPDEACLVSRGLFLEPSIITHRPLITKIETVDKEEKIDINVSMSCALLEAQQKLLEQMLIIGMQLAS